MRAWKDPSTLEILYAYGFKPKTELWGLFVQHAFDSHDARLVLVTLAHGFQLPRHLEWVFKSAPVKLRELDLVWKKQSMNLLQYIQSIRENVQGIGFSADLAQEILDMMISEDEVMDFMLLF